MKKEKSIKIYKVTMFKRSLSNPNRFIYTDLEEFSQDKLLKLLLLNKLNLHSISGNYKEKKNEEN